jgi:hypothetical protein
MCVLTVLSDKTKSAAISSLEQVGQPHQNLSLALRQLHSDQRIRRSSAIPGVNDRSRHQFGHRCDKWGVSIRKTTVNDRHEVDDFADGCLGVEAGDEDGAVRVVELLLGKRIDCWAGPQCPP